MFTQRNSEAQGTRSCRREPLDRRWQRRSLLSTCLCLLCFTTAQMKKAVITSITDSSYLTEILLSQRYVMYGMLVALVHALGQLDDPEEHVLIAPWKEKEPDWLKPFVGKNQSIVRGNLRCRPPSE